MVDSSMEFEKLEAESIGRALLKRPFKFSKFK
jgi:hypothetical protein